MAPPRLVVHNPHGIDAYPPLPSAPRYPHPLTPAITLLPLLPHPETRAPPPPLRPALPPPPAGFVRTLHAVPAAYPRTTPESHGTLSRGDNPFGVSQRKDEGDAERKERVTAETERCVHLRYDAPTWSLDQARVAAPSGLWLAAERWRRQEPRGGYTLVCTHANGLLKEHWHAVLHSLLTRSPAAHAFGTGARLPPHSVQIDDIWLLDASISGASVDLNAGRMGGVHMWVDAVRDVLNFVEHVLPPAEAPAQWHAPWHPLGAGSPRPRVIGVGHSFGANALAQASHAHPGLFEALLLVEPATPPLYRPPEFYHRPIEGFPASYGALRRRDVWPSRAAAREQLAATPFFARWNPQALDVYIAHGLVDVPGGVTLATPCWAEAACFTEPDGIARGWDKLACLTVPTGFFVAGDPGTTFGEETTCEMVWRPKRARNERLMGAGHLLVQEVPVATADALARFLATISAGVWDRDDSGGAKL